jgi:hypothetical protein
MDVPLACAVLGGEITTSANSEGLISLQAEVTGTEEESALATEGVRWTCARLSGEGAVRVFRQTFTHSRMPLVPTPLLRLKRAGACDQWHSSRASTFLTSSHCKLRPNTEGYGPDCNHNPNPNPNHCKLRPNTEGKAPCFAAGVAGFTTITLPTGASIKLSTRSLYGARFPAEIYTRGCHWIPRMFA